MVRSIDGKYVGTFDFYAEGEKYPIREIFFSADLSHALVRNPDGQGSFLLDTTEFRNYLDAKGLLFRTTTATATENRIRIRENPHLEAQTFGHLGKGDELEVLDRSGIKVKVGDIEDWWYRVKRKSDGLTGWAYGAFLKLASYQGELGLKK